MAENQRRLEPPPHEAAHTNVRAVSALLLGIFGLALPLLSPAAVVLALKALKQQRQGVAEGKTAATAGLILGYIGSAWLAFCLLIAGIYLVGYLTGEYPPK